MLGQYQHLCLVEEFQKLKDDTPMHNLWHKLVGERMHKHFFPIQNVDLIPTVIVLFLLGGGRLFYQIKGQ